MTKMLTTPGIPRRSPIQVLTGPEFASLPRSNEIGSTQPGMVAVTQPSTNRARGCFTSEIERDRVYSTWRSPIQVLTGPEVALTRSGLLNLVWS
ncbi:unnamed protein product [Clavelina lepadiformis]|uniref:Uncharacterized protein n=1 Tax=Clavelina lepadiformis TaxID=159417 RepID=A0ABP0G3Q1_CLALP